MSVSGSSTESVNLSDTQTAFQWKIPSLTTDTKQLHALCGGYFRILQRSLQSPYHMPSDILGLCVRSLDESWLIHQIQNAKCGDVLKSDFFSIGDFKFYIDLYPNGFDESSSGFCDMFLNLASLSPIIPRISLSHCLRFSELDHEGNEPQISDYRRAEFQDDNISIHIRRHTHNEMISLQSMTMSLHISELLIHYDVIGNASNTPNHSHTVDTTSLSVHIETDLRLIQDTFTWTLYPKQEGTSLVSPSKVYWESELFVVNGFKFMGKIYKTSGDTLSHLNETSVEDQYDLALSLASLSPSIERLCLFYSLVMVVEDDNGKKGM